MTWAAKYNISGSLLLFAFLLLACSPGTSPSIRPTATPGQSAPAVVPTIGRPATSTAVPPTVTRVSPAPSSSPTTTAVVRPVSWDRAVPALVAITRERIVYPPSGDRSYPEHGIEVYAPPSPDPVFSLVQEGTSYDMPRFSPDGRWLVYQESPGRQGIDRLRIVDTDWQTDRPLTTWFEKTTTLRWLAWSPDGRWLALQRADRDAKTRPGYALEVATGAIHLLGPFVTAFAWSAEEPPRLAFAVQEEYRRASLHVIAVDDWANDRLVEVLPAEAMDGVSALAWQPGSSLLAVCARGWYLLDFAALPPAIVDQNPRIGCFWSRWTADGRWLAYGRGSSVESVEVINIYDVEHKQLAWQLRARSDYLAYLWVGPYYDWVGDEILLSFEILNKPGTGVPVGFAITGVAVESLERKTLWSSMEVNMGQEFSPEFDQVVDIAWHLGR